MLKELFEAKNIKGAVFNRPTLMHFHYRDLHGYRIPEETISAGQATTETCEMAVQQYRIPITQTDVFWCYCEKTKIFFWESRSYQKSDLEIWQAKRERMNEEEKAKEQKPGVHYINADSMNNQLIKERVELAGNMVGDFTRYAKKAGITVMMTIATVSDGKGGTGIALLINGAFGPDAIRELSKVVSKGGPEAIEGIRKIISEVM
jgi:hypothetical protein